MLLIVIIPEYLLIGPPSLGGPPDALGTGLAIIILFNPINKFIAQFLCLSWIFTREQASYWKIIVIAFTMALVYFLAFFLGIHLISNFSAVKSIPYQAYWTQQTKDLLVAFLVTLANLPFDFMVIYLFFKGHLSKAKFFWVAIATFIAVLLPFVLYNFDLWVK